MVTWQQQSLTQTASLLQLMKFVLGPSIQQCYTKRHSLNWNRYNSAAHQAAEVNAMK